MHWGFWILGLIALGLLGILALLGYVAITGVIRYFKLRGR